MDLNAVCSALPNILCRLHGHFFVFAGKAGTITGLLNRKDIRHSGDSERLPENILALQQYLDAHYTEINSVSEVAEHFFYSREYVSRLFKKYYDTTILDYIHKLRISKSRALIAEGMPIIDVCYAVGFSSLSTFIRAFRTATDMTPSEYRRMVRDGG